MLCRRAVVFYLYGCFQLRQRGGSVKVTSFCGKNANTPVSVKNCYEPQKSKTSGAHKLFGKNGQSFKEDDVFSVRRVALCQNSGSADGFASRFAYKRLKRFERFARADNVVDDKNSFAFHLFRFVRAETESLNSLRRDRADIDAYRGGHIYFFAFSCDDVLVFALLF